MRWSNFVRGLAQTSLFRRNRRRRLLLFRRRRRKSLLLLLRPRRGFRGCHGRLRVVQVVVLLVKSKSQKLIYLYIRDSENSNNACRRRNKRTLFPANHEFELCACMTTVVTTSRASLFGVKALRPALRECASSSDRSKIGGLNGRSSIIKCSSSSHPYARVQTSRCDRICKAENASDNLRRDHEPLCV